MASNLFEPDTEDLCLPGHDRCCLVKLGRSLWALVGRAVHIRNNQLSLVKFGDGKVFCNSAIRAAEHDHTIMMQNRNQFRDMAADLFKKMDSSGFGQITINEFESLYDDEDMKAFLDSWQPSGTLLSFCLVMVFLIKKPTPKKVP